METIISIITTIAIAIGAYLFGSRIIGRGMGGAGDDLDRAGDANRRAGDGVRVSRDGVGRSVRRNKRVGELLKRGRAILDKAKARSRNKGVDKSRD